MHVLVIKHAREEGPGTLGDFLQEKGIEAAEVRLYEGDSLPAAPSSEGAVIVMGGPMNVYEEDRYPFLAEENAFIGEALRRGVPLLGICLGAQLLARACGARITRALRDEVGWSRVTLTEQGMSDPLLQGLGREFEVFQWHEDTFDVPGEGVHLAESEVCRNQAFRFGANAYGLQFHVEMTPRMVDQWYRNCPQKERALAHFEQIRPEFNHRARLLYMNFLALAMGSSGSLRNAPEAG